MQQIKDLKSVIILSAISTICSILIKVSLNLTESIESIIIVVVFIGIYLFCSIIFRISAFNYILEIIKSRVKLNK